MLQSSDRKKFGVIGEGGMETRTIERRRHPRGGLFARIEDVTYRVLRETESDASGGEEGVLAELEEGIAIPSVNVTFGLSADGQPGEPF